MASAGTKIRQIEAPADDFLTVIQVAVHLGYKDAKSVYDAVAAGELPEPLLRRGVQVWEWEVILWYPLNIRFGTRLRQGDEAPKHPPEEEPPIPSRGRKTN